MVNAEAIKAEYAPYNKMQAFEVGYNNVIERRNWINHHYKNVNEQAYDRGCEAACRVMKAEQWTMNNVGLD